MPAPGGNFAGAPSDSRGYASGTGAAGGKPASPSGGTTGNTSKGGATAAASGGSKMGAGSSQTGGTKAAGAAAGSKMGASSSQTGGLKSSGNATGAGYSGPKGTPSGGLNAAAKNAAAAAGTKNTGYSGPKGTPSGGLNSGARNAAAAAQAANNRTTNTLAAAKASYSGPKGTPEGGLNQGARLAAARAGGFSAPAVRATPGEIDAMARMMIAESQSIRNKYGLPSTPAMQAVGDVMRNRVLSDRFPDTVGGVLTQKGQFSPLADGSFGRITPSHPQFQAAKDLAESILAGESPSLVGGALNYGNLHTINNKPGYSSAATKAAFNSMPVAATFADARTPSLQHSFGTIGTPSDVSFGALGRPAVAQPANPSMPALANAGPQAAPGPQATPMGAFLAATQPREQANGYLGSIVGMGFPGRPGEKPGAFPAAPYGGAAMAGYGLSPSQRGMTTMASMVAGMPSIPSPTGFPAAQPGHENPPRSFAGISGQFPAIGAPDPVSVAQLRNPQSGMSFNPGLPGQMKQPNMDMNGYASPMARVTNLPQTNIGGMPGYQSPMAGVGALPQSNPGGMGNYRSPMAVDPSGMPRALSDPSGGMSFNPALPGQMPGPSRSRSPGPPLDAIASAEPEEDFMERTAEYDPLSSVSAPRSPTTNVPGPAPAPGGWGLANLVPNVPSIPGITEPLDPETKKMIGLGLRWAPYLTETPEHRAARMQHQQRRNAPAYLAGLGGTSNKKKRKKEDTAPMGLAPPEQADMPAWLQSVWA